MNSPSATPAGGFTSIVGRDALLLDALLRSMPDFIYFKDRDGRFLAVSASLVRAFGKDNAADVVGRTGFDFFPAVFAHAARDDEETIMATGEPLIEKLEEIPWPTGNTMWGIVTKLPLRDRERRVIGTFGLTRDVTAKKRMEDELEKAHRDLVDASRIAGMAEVATGVLHNVGNVLNSLNVSASVVATGLRQSKADSLVRIAALLKEHEPDLGNFLSSDPKGKRVPEFLSSLAHHAIEERERLLQELASLQKNVDHMKEIVAMQQAYATMIGVVEPLDAGALLEDAVRMNAGALQRHDVQVERDYQAVPRVVGEQSKVLQILVNLIRNAKYACDDGGVLPKRITLRLRRTGLDRVQIVVEDNGVGIPSQNLTRIFQHGFTTRAKGHGFGLHSAANAAREMKGTLTVESEGPGKGACFTLELPVAAPTEALA